MIIKRKRKYTGGLPRADTTPTSTTDISRTTTTTIYIPTFRSHRLIKPLTRIINPVGISLQFSNSNTKGMATIQLWLSQFIRKTLILCIIQNSNSNTHCLLRPIRLCISSNRPPPSIYDLNVNANIIQYLKSLLLLTGLKMYWLLLCLKAEKLFCE